MYAMIGVSHELTQALRQEHDALWKGRPTIGDQVMFERAKLLMSYSQRGFSLSQSLQVSSSLYSYYTDSVSLQITRARSSSLHGSV